MGLDYDEFQVLIAWVSGEKMFDLAIRDRQRLELGPILVIYGVDAGLRGEEIRLERCPDELCLDLLNSRGYEYRGHDTIRILGSEPSHYPEIPHRNQGIMQNRRSGRDPRCRATGPTLSRKTNNGWRR